MTCSTGAQWLVAPAKLTLSLQVLGRRDDGYHEIESEMVSIDLHDRLFVDPAGDGLEIVAGPVAGLSTQQLSAGADNIVVRALRTVGRSALVRLHKQIPVGGGLGGGSADAAAVLRWAGVQDMRLAARLGADVPFCVLGGRAVVGGIGERTSPLPFELRRFVLLAPPFPVDTGAVYRMWDRIGTSKEPADRDWLDPEGRNALTGAALAVEPRLVHWGELLHERTGRPVVLAGSGSTWWVEGDAGELGLSEDHELRLDGEEGRLFGVQTVPASWTG